MKTSTMKKCLLPLAILCLCLTSAPVQAAPIITHWNLDFDDTPLGSIAFNTDGSPWSKGESASPTAAIIEAADAPGNRVLAIRNTASGSFILDSALGGNTALHIAPYSNYLWSFDLRQMSASGNGLSLNLVTLSASPGRYIAAAGAPNAKGDFTYMTSSSPQQMTMADQFSLIPENWYRFEFVITTGEYIPNTSLGGTMDLSYALRVIDLRTEEEVYTASSAYKANDIRHNQSVRLYFVAPQGTDIQVDNLVLQTIPEPETVAFLLFGTGLLALKLRGQKNP